MIRQDFSVNSLLRITTKNEIVKFNLGRNKEEYAIALSQVSNYLLEGNEIIDNLSCRIERNKVIFSTNSINTFYALKKISKDLSRLYKIEPPNRDDISEQIYRIFEHSTSYSIVRLDIKSFYENIQYNEVIKKLDRDKILVAKSIKILKDLYNFIDNGLPRGLSISPILSEIFMKEVDQQIRNIDHVYYYARYVDDIIVISTDKSDSIYEKTIKVLEKYDLNVNSKRYIKNIPAVNNDEISTLYKFDYLGYKYIIDTISYKNKRIVKAELSDDKKRKIKTRIIHSLLDRVYNTTHYDREELLIKRLKVLSSNYSITYNELSKTNLKAGMFYSHRLVNNYGIFSEFNKFLSKAIYCQQNNFFGKAMSQIPSKEKENIIKSICFVSGFKDKNFIELERVEMERVKKCWKNKRYKKL
ncbi:antiviral reverse transcriptase Drt3a [Acinetobacter nosocomialis]|uniref:antiviral reverse transcriptase Drt3a n=1 Tax=Acinetobacter nosocomialis TaxID=106654 RepID=UPI0005A6069F|nr:antiviral reverse transcriptase Drt3a [Acinetobacter nosocomialis]MBO8215822.1 RNA-directed DNA polymerase [Acinetobacter nosocomialis]MCU4553568.1 RNA-directed DNA polymerase [Acinetobacter nosocomialis]